MDESESDVVASSIWLNFLETDAFEELRDKVDVFEELRDKVDVFEELRDKVGDAEFNNICSELRDTSGDNACAGKWPSIAKARLLAKSGGNCC